MHSMPLFIRVALSTMMLSHFPYRMREGLFGRYFFKHLSGVVPERASGCGKPYLLYLGLVLFPDALPYGAVFAVHRSQLVGPASRAALPTGPATTMLSLFASETSLSFPEGGLKGLYRGHSGRCEYYVVYVGIRSDKRKRLCACETVVSFGFERGRARFGQTESPGSVERGKFRELRLIAFCSQSDYFKPLREASADI